MAQEDTAPDTAPADAEPDEGAQLQEFLAERNIDVSQAGIRTREGSAYEGTVRDPDDPDDDGSDEEAEAAPAEDEPEAEAEPPEPEAGREDPRSVAFKLRQRERDVEVLGREIQQRDAYLNAFLLALHRGEQPPAQNGHAAPAPEEPDPDLFVDPPGFVDHRVQQAIQPLVHEIQVLKAENQRLAGEHQQERDQQQFAGYVGQVQHLAQSYEAENPGYYDRMNQFSEEYQQGLVENGWSPEEAQQTWLQEVAAMTNAAMQRGQNPAAFIDYHARRYVANGAAPASPPQPQRQDGRLAAARRAQEAGATRRGGGAAGAPTIEDVRRAGITPERAAEVISSGGRGKFLAMMREVERKA